MAKRMALAASADFCRRFGTAFRAGVDVLTLCQTEAKRGSDRHRDVMANVAQGVSQGESLADAMVKADAKYFPSLMLSMVRLGEEAGTLERTMLQLADHYKHRIAVRRTFLMAIAWPAFELTAAIGVIGLLILILGFLPTGANGKPFDPLGLGLYGAQGLLIYLIFVGLFASLFLLFYLALKNNWGNVHALIPLAYMIPKLGGALQTIGLSRFTWTLAMAQEAGLDPFRSIELSMESTGSDHYRSETPRAKQAIRDGETLAGALAKTEVFPHDFLSALEVAEVSGTAAESLAHLADDYDQRARQAVRVIAGIATVLIMLLVFGIIIFAIFRMALNVFGVYQDAATI